MVFITCSKFKYCFDFELLSLKSIESWEVSYMLRVYNLVLNSLESLKSIESWEVSCMLKVNNLAPSSLECKESISTGRKIQAEFFYPFLNCLEKYQGLLEVFILYVEKW